MTIDSLQVELTIVLGKARMPLRQLLRLGRGAVVALDPSEQDVVEILANGLPVARGRVAISGEAITVEVTDLIRKPTVSRAPGATIGGGMKVVDAPAADTAPTEAAPAG